VPANVLEGQLGSQLRDQGFDAAAIVMLGGPGAGTLSTAATASSTPLLPD